jgi:hypothetical protein
MQHLTCSVQVNHVSKKKYSPWKNRLNLFMMVTSVVTYFGYMADPFFYPSYYTRFMLLVTVIAEWHYILNVIYEMANALGIRVLFVKQKNTPVQVKGKVYENFVDENDGPTEL